MKMNSFRARCSYWLLLASLVALIASVGAHEEPSNLRELTEKSSSREDDELASAELIVDESRELRDEDLSNIMEDFGQHIKSVMSEEMQKLIDEVEESKRGVNEEELEKFKSANEMMARDAEISIEQAGQKNEGQFTQSGASSAEKQETLVSQVSQRLQSAGAFIGQKLNSLSWLAPRIKGKWESVPAQLRKLFHWPSFLNFKIKFNKCYKSLREELYRQMLFLRAQTIVGMQRLKYLMGKSSHLLKATEFSDWTYKEHKERHSNELAENDELDGDERDEMSPSTRAKLEAIAMQKKNIYGNSMEHVIDKARRRKKRSIDLNVEAFNELDDEEDEEDEGEDFPSEESPSETHDEPNAVSKVVDEYASQFKTIPSDLDNEVDDFEPIDLRETGCIIKPEHQWQCGNCFAQVVSAAMSYFNCMEDKEKKLVRYNPRFVSDCGRYLWPEGEKTYINGCQGGRLQKAVQFARSAGTHRFMSYVMAHSSFDGQKSDRCAFPRPQDILNWAPIQVPFLKRSKYVNIRMSDVDLHLRTIGPVFLNILTWKNFASFGQGILDTMEDAESTVPHSMLIVGHDRDSHGRDYWIIWNSFGKNWGENGFARIYDDVLDYYKLHLGGFEPIDE